MKVLHINTFDYGGAANACIRLHQEMLKQGIDSNILFLENKKRKVEKAFTYKYLLSFRERVKYASFNFVNNNKIFKRFTISKENYLQNRPEAVSIFNSPFSTKNIERQPIYKQADIVNLHWVAQFIDYPTFFKKNTKPLVWTLHDMNPFTAGCHSSFHCSKYIKGCEKCPQLSSSLKNNYAKRFFSIKNRAFENLNITVVSPSKWLMNESLKSRILGRQNHVNIFNGVDDDVFKIISKKDAKAHFDISSELPVILFVSDNIKDKLKGFHILIEALRKIKDLHFILAIVGHKQKIVGLPSNIKIKKLGYLVSEKEMALAYNASDAYITPSLQDNLPNTLLESVLCGTPVIGFNIGGIPEIIENNLNGFLCFDTTSESLEKTLRKFLSKPLYFDRHKIKNHALTKFSGNMQAKKYIELYCSLLKI